MKKEIIILRLISALFVISAIVTLSSFLWIKANLMLTLYLLGNAILSIAVAVGLIKRYQWARWLAIVLMIVGVVNSLVGAFKDIEILAARSVESITIVFSLATAVLLWAVIATLIWWLAKSSTKALFNSKA